MNNLTITLASRPEGEPTSANFGHVESKPPETSSGTFVYRTRFISLDPYLRGRMSDQKSYAQPFAVGSPMVSGFVGEVVESQNEKFKKGDLVSGLGPWTQLAVSDGKGLHKVPKDLPPTSVLGVLGMPGLTAYVGLLDIGRARAGETVVVAAASGAVGAVVGQLAKIKGCRVIGIAGGTDKCSYVKEELGFDECIDYRTQDVGEALRRFCPKGIDVNFENVGGKILAAVMQNLADGARIALCGMISEYNIDPAPAGPNLRPLLVHKASIQGFIVSDHGNRLPAFLEEMVPLVRAGRIKMKEDIVRGLERAPEAFIGLLNGKNFGKLLVEIE